MNAMVRPGPASDAAWNDYLKALDEGREKLLAHPFCRTEADRVRCVYDVQMLAAMGFNMYVAPRRSHPVFYIHQFFMPFEITWGQLSPDVVYRWAFLTGANTYRIWGKLGTTAHTELQVMDGFWGDEKCGHVATIELAKHARPDGTFELSLSPDPQPGRDWVGIPRQARNVVLQCRDIWGDWETDVGLQMWIEPVELVAADDWVLSQAEMDQRLREAARWVSYNVDFFISRMAHVIKVAGGTDRFAVQWDGETTGFSGGIASALKARMIYDIQPDEVIVVDVEAPRAVQWNYSVGDLWWLTVDYSYHQSSLNGAQATPESDGRMRFVMAHRDPGVANWIDVVGSTQGMAHLRCYVPLDGYRPEPIVTKMKASELDAFLPADTPRVTPEERRQILARRARASLARYGY